MMIPIVSAVTSQMKSVAVPSSEFNIFIFTIENLTISFTLTYVILYVNLCYPFR
jgi:hypothetical protein